VKGWWSGSRGRVPRVQMPILPKIKQNSRDLGSTIYRLHLDPDSDSNL
jgi:hypothetical protein